MNWEKHDAHNEYVVYTLPAASGGETDVREVLKVFVPAWEEDAAERSEDDQLEISEERFGLLRAWVRRALRAPQVQATLATLAAWKPGRRSGNSGKLLHPYTP